MKFVLGEVSSHGVRTGKLFGIQPAGDCTTNIYLDTPLCLPHTRAGFIPYLTPDIVSNLQHKPPAAMLILASMYDTPGKSVLNEYGKGIHKFLSMEGTILYMSVQDPSDQPIPSYNDTKTVSVWNPSGRKKVNVSEHMSLVESFQPDMFESLCDTVSSLDNQAKRIKKSVDRTLEFLDQSLEIKKKNEKLKHVGILGAIEGSDIVEERVRSAKETSLRSVDGFVIEGFQLPHDPDKLQHTLSSIVDVLPYDKPRFIHGLYKPSDIFRALECGVDVFDTSYALKATEEGRALIYPNKLIAQENINPVDSSALNEGSFEIDLSNKKYRESMKPVLANCTCYTCTNYTCAYIYHLLDTKEMMAKILLMIHNFSHIFEFFHNLRQSLVIDKYLEFKSFCSNV